MALDRYEIILGNSLELSLPAGHQLRADWKSGGTGGNVRRHGNYGPDGRGNVEANGSVVFAPSAIGNLLPRDPAHRRGRVIGIDRGAASASSHAEGASKCRGDEDSSWTIDLPHRTRCVEMLAELNESGRSIERNGNEHRQAALVGWFTTPRWGSPPKRCGDAPSRSRDHQRSFGVSSRSRTPRAPERHGGHPHDGGRAPNIQRGCSKRGRSWRGGSRTMSASAAAGSRKAITIAAAGYRR